LFVTTFYNAIGVANIRTSKTKQQASLAILPPA